MLLLLHPAHQLFVIPLDLDKLRGHPRVLDTHGHVGGPVPGHQDLLQTPAHVGEPLKGGVVDPGDVGAVGPPVVETDHQGEFLLDICEKIQHLIAAGGVFHQHHLGAALSELEVLHAPEAAFEVLNGGDGGVGAKTHLGHGGHGACGVVDVIEGGEIDFGQIPLPAGAEHDAAALGGLGRDPGHGVFRRLPTVAAVGAAEAAQVAVGDIVVFVFGLAADAVAGVGQLALLRGGHGALIDAEENDPVRQIARERRGEGAVGVETERRLRHGGDAGAHVFQGVGHLAVAVQLIPEEVRHHDHLRPELGEDLHGGGLIALDDGVLPAALAGERGIHHELGRDAGDQVCAGAVGKIALALLGEGLLDHAGGGGLAVGAGDGDGLDVPGQDAQQVRTDAQGPAAGHGGAAPVQDAGKPAQPLAEQNGEKSTKTHGGTPLNLYFDKKSVLFVEKMPPTAAYSC